MDALTSLFAEHGLLAVFAAVLVEQLGAPVPALPFLLLAGVAAAGDGILALKALAVATLASTLADGLWFYAGRRYGRRVLALLCKVSISPDTCVRQSELNFARRGVATLVIAKFVPGLSTLASPLAGALGMRTSSFILFNLAGTILWAGSGIAGGLIFHDQIEALLRALGKLGDIAMPFMGAVLVFYVAWRAWRRRREAQANARLPRLQPDDLSQLINSGTGYTLLDVRGAAVALPGQERIPGSRHIEIRDIETALLDDWPVDVELVTYCACPNDASAVKAAHLLTQRGFSVRVLNGGIDAWVESGHPVEAN
jgi:membrane protein DedA with SNARE-associated domain/rhodanese-related sulfurtransferase